MWPSGKASPSCSTETLKMRALGVGLRNLATRRPRQSLTAQRLCLFIPCYLLFRAPPRFWILNKLRYQNYAKKSQVKGNSKERSPSSIVSHNVICSFQEKDRTFIRCMIAVVVYKKFLELKKKLFLLLKIIANLHQ